MTIKLIGGHDARAVAWANARPDGQPPGNDHDLRVAILRLAASRVCPCTRDVLAGVVNTALRGVIAEDDASTTRIDEEIDALISAGDLIAGRTDIDGRQRPLVYLGPPMFVRRASGIVFVMGGLPEGSVPFQTVTRYHGALRVLEPAPTDEELVDAGYAPYPIDAWMESPTPRSARAMVDELERGLAAIGLSGTISDVEILDPDRPVDFYRGRWVAPRRQTGNFVARRTRKWGGRAWGYAELAQGQVVRFRTFPVVDGRFRACDEAWWAICAQDALRGAPQAITIVDLPDVTRLAFQMPIPMWAERRLLTLGSQSEIRPKGTLVAFDVRSADATEEVEFLATRLWMEPRRERG
jgi:hypothetical protein